MLLRRILFAGFAVLVSAAAQAQTYPDRPIRLIAPFPAGGLADVLARAVGDEMSKSLGQPVIVENRAGAGGNTGADAVAKAASDGYTLLMSSAGILTANPFLYAKMPFDVETAFIPVSNVADMSMLVVVNPKVEAKTLKEFVALAKANPGKLNFGSPGIGTTGHLGLAMLMHAADVKIAHVPYRGAAPCETHRWEGRRLTPRPFIREASMIRVRSMMCVAMTLLVAACGENAAGGGCAEDRRRAMRQLGFARRSNWATAPASIAKHGIAVEAVCTQGTGETQQAVISGSADIGIGVGTLGALGAYARARRSASSRAARPATPTSGSSKAIRRSRPSRTRPTQPPSPIRATARPPTAWCSASSASSG